MFVVIGTVTADLLVLSEATPGALGGDGFRSSNLVFTEAPLTISMGGNGGNSAYALAGLGAPTVLCGAVGRDMLGDALAGWLEARGVRPGGLMRSPTEATSSSTIIMTGADQQVVFHHLGATRAANFEDMPADLFDSAQALLVSSYPIMPRLRAGGFARALARVKRAGGLTALDIGPAIGEPVTLAEIQPLLADVDYFIANTHELSALTGEADRERAAEHLLKAGARNVVIKQGAEGASILSPRARIHVPGFAVEAKVTVGAGDTFNAGMIFSLTRGDTPEQALRFANACAALLVRSARGILDAPALADVEAFLNAQP